MSAKPPKVIIIGAGLAGPVLALSLARHSISSAIFELRHQSTTPDGGYLALAPNALRVLDSIGIYSRISQSGYNYEELQFVSARNLSILGSVQNGDNSKYDYRALRVGRHIVRQALLDELDRTNINVMYGAKCVGISEHGGEEGLISGFASSSTRRPVSVHFDNGQTESADFVVGADGIHSRVRDYISPGSTPLFQGQMGIGGILNRSSLHASASNLYMPCMIIGRENSFMLMPTNYSGSEVGCFATVEAKDRSREEWNLLGSDKVFLKEMFERRHCGENGEGTTWPGVVKDAARAVQLPSLTVWPFYSVPKLASWVSVSGRVILVGDSAHAIPPTGGQGAAMALEDAATLAEAIALQHQDVDLAKWQTHRQARIAKIVTFTTRGSDIRKSTVSPFQQLLKEWAMWLYLWWKGKEGGLGWIYEYKVATAVDEMR